MNSKRFVSFLKYAAMSMALLMTVAISSCDDGDDGEKKPTKNIWELVQADDNLSMLEEQLAAAGLDATLSGDTEMTLFAPSNAAMQTLLQTLGLSDFESIAPSVTEAVLKYHIANSQYLASALTNNTQITTEQGEKITVLTTSTGEITFQTGATSTSKVTTSDIKATNGVIHVVDVVMVPPTVGALIIKTLGTVAQPILLSSDFTTLAAGLRKADEFAAGASLPSLTDILINEAEGFETMKYTVFAPTNATFEAGSLTADSFTGQQWYGIISHHIVANPTEYYGSADDFSQGTQFSTLATQSTTKKLTVLTTEAPIDQEHGILTGIAIDSNGDTTPEAQVAVLDVLTASGATPANNGVINVIAGVLKPQ